MSKHELSVDILNNGLFQLSPTPPTLVQSQSPSFLISLDTPLTCSISNDSISGNIIIQVPKQIKNRDFHIEFIGSCIRYSNNPYSSIEESDRSIIRHESVSEFVSDILNHTSKREIDTDTNEEIFLEGSQILRYVGNVGEEEVEREIEIDTLKPGKYYLPFNFDLPEGSPPSVGMIGFITIFFTIQYKIIIHEFLTQPIVLQRTESPPQIQQLLCTSLQISFKRFCFVCLGDYCLESIARRVFNSLHVKLQFYRKGEKSENSLLLDSVRVSLVGEIVNVGKQVIAENVVVLEDLEYGIKGVEFILCDLGKLKMKSYENSMFHLRYYLELEPRAVVGITRKVKKVEKVFLEI